MSVYGHHLKFGKGWNSLGAGCRDRKTVGPGY